ncbi:MAG: SMC-Scp complex subunit ScpB [Geminicoccaceae bacterium]|nr:SMC-Scp complex subunit ScpB [Geminicoccaceae bacterium]
MSEDKFPAERSTGQPEPPREDGCTQAPAAEAGRPDRSREPDGETAGSPGNDDAGGPGTVEESSRPVANGEGGPELLSEAKEQTEDGKADIEPRFILEALLFQSDEPLEEKVIQAHLGPSVAILPLLEQLRKEYEGRGIRLERSERRWAFRTCAEVAPFMTRSEERPKRLSRAALETLAIIAYQQPVTRAEVEAVRGVPVSSGTLDLLVDAGWVTPKGRKEAPGRPVMWGTTPDFLDYFALSALEDLPRLDELEGAGLFKPLREDSA